MKYEKFAAMDARLAGKAAERLRSAAALRADQRDDEAALEMAAANVYDIFRAVMAAAEKASINETAAQAFFVRKLEEIPAVWQASRALAQQHGDEVKAYTESIKLAATEDIKEEWRKRA